MLKKIPFLPVLAAVLFFAAIQSLWAVPSGRPWLERDATARVFINVPRSSGAVACDVLWRLPWQTPEYGAEEAGRHISVYRASDGRQVDNFYVRELTQDRIAIAFEAFTAGDYELYYTPGADVGTNAFSRPIWMKKHRPDNYPDYNRMPRGVVTGVESRYGKPDNPYDVSATRTETDAYFSRAKKSFEAYLVPAGYPLNGDNRLPLAWAVSGDGKDAGGFFSRMFGKKQDVSSGGDTVRVPRGGKVLIQAGIVCTEKTPVELTVRHTSAPSAGVVLKLAGNKKITLSPRELRSAWIVAECSDEAVKGFYDLSVRIEGTGQSLDLPFVLEVTEENPETEGSLVAEFVSRIGSKPEAAAKKTPVNDRFPVTVYEGYEVRSGKNVLAINPATALPSQIYSDSLPLLADPVLLVFSTANGIRKIGVKDLRFVRRDGGVQVWRGSVRTHDMNVELQASLSAFGLVQYEVDVEALSNIDFRNISLEAGFSREVTRACYDTVCVVENATVSLNPRENFSGLWLGGDRGGVFVTVDKDPSNVFYSGDNASVTLYKGSQTGLIVGSGAMRMRSGEKIALKCSMQILPADYALPTAAGRRIQVVSLDTLPQPDSNILADLWVVNDPFILLDGRNDRGAEALSDKGAGILPYIRPFALPSSSDYARILVSMGFAGRTENTGRTLYFEPSEELVPAMEYLYRRILDKKYIKGVLLSDSPYNMEKIGEYSLMRTRKGEPFLVFLRENGLNASLLGYTPWIDAVVTGDTLGACAGDCQASLGGLTEYFKASRGNVLATLSFGKPVYADDADSASVRTAEAVWRVRKTLGLDTPDMQFYPERAARMPVRADNPFVRLSGYVLPDRIVVIARNTSPAEQGFVPEFDFGALGIRRWEVDRLEIAGIAGFQTEKMLLMGDRVPIGADGTLVLVLRWEKRAVK